MLPFSSIEFYLFGGIVLAVLLLFKTFVKKLEYGDLLFGLGLIYIIFLYPKPWHIFLYVLYSYSIIWLFHEKIKLANKLGGILSLILPMLLVKFDIRFHIYPFSLNYWLSFAGLSYMCFRTVSVYMDLKPVDKKPSLVLFSSYLIFFPTVLIGPIDRIGRFRKDVDRGFGGISMKAIIEGWESLLLGVFYKYICAEFINRYWLKVVDYESLEIKEMALSMYGYYFYLFFDFAGYSLLAIGLGKMLGIDVPINFVKPFLARNPQDFWKRFHKSLGDWLSDYFFKPLYMFLSRQKKLKKFPLTRQNLALFATFILMGAWNGFQKSFIVSGVVFGIYSVVYNSYIYYCKKKKKDIFFGNLPARIVDYVSIFIMFNLAAFSIYIFSGRCPFL